MIQRRDADEKTKHVSITTPHVLQDTPSCADNPKATHVLQDTRPLRKQTDEVARHALLHPRVQHAADMHHRYIWPDGLSTHPAARALRRHGDRGAKDLQIWIAGLAATRNETMHIA
jgi:hypothetical protein